MNQRIAGALITLAIAGASVFAVAQQTPAPVSTPPITETPTAAPSGYGQCAYTWSYQDLPEITAEFQAAVQVIAPQAEARAIAFGEVCARQNAPSTFGAMQTDFYLRIPVTDLNDDAALGGIIERLLAVTDRFDHTRVPGPKDGFVEFTFTNRNDQRILRVDIALGKRLREQGLRGAELVRGIQNP